MTQKRHTLHGRDHTPDGADPIPGGGGGGIQFDSYPQAGGWLYAGTTNGASSPNGYGVELDDTSGDGIWLHSTANLDATGDAAVTIESAAGDVYLHAPAAGRAVRLTAPQIILDSADGDLALDSAGVRLDSAAYGYLHLQSSGVRLQTNLTDGQPHQLGLAASSTIKLDAGLGGGAGGAEAPAIFMSAFNIYGGESFSIIAQSATIPAYPQSGFLFEMGHGGKLTIADADYTAVHGDQPIFVIDYTTLLPTYHIKAGASWIADL